MIRLHLEPVKFILALLGLLLFLLFVVTLHSFPTLWLFVGLRCGCFALIIRSRYQDSFGLKDIFNLRNYLNNRGILINLERDAL